MTANEEISIRRIRKGDGERLFSVFMSAIQELAAGDYTSDQLRAWTSHITPSRLEARMLMTNGYAAERDAVIVGFGALDVNHAELDFLYVHPEFARQGIGRSLAKTIEDEAIRRGLRGLELTASLNAVLAYEQLGYRRISDMSKTIDGVKVPCVRMAKTLG